MAKSSGPEIIAENKGVLRESVTNSRIMIFSCAAYRSMCNSLFDQFQSGWGIILYRMGQGYAEKLVEGISELNLSREEAIEMYQGLAWFAGWGDVKIKIEDEKKSVCTVRRSAFVLRRSDVGSTSCFFFSGALSTIASSVMGKKFDAREDECVSGGFEHCKFVLTESQWS
jgi:predicted hydrocarbon binding protein